MANWFPGGNKGRQKMANYLKIETSKKKRKRLRLGIKRLTISKKEKEFTLEITKRQLQEFQEELNNLGDFP